MRKGRILKATQQRAAGFYTALNTERYPAPRGQQRTGAEFDIYDFLGGSGVPRGQMPSRALQPSTPQHGLAQLVSIQTDYSNNRAVPRAARVYSWHQLARVKASSRHIN